MSRFVELDEADLIGRPIRATHPYRMSSRALHAGSPCGCPICVTSRSIRAMREALDGFDNATEEWLERSTEDEMALHYLLDELESFIRSPLSWPIRKRLRHILRVATPQP